MVTGAIAIASVGANAEILSGLEKHWSFDGNNSELISGVVGSGINNPAYSNNTHDGSGQSIALNGYNQKVVVDNTIRFPF